MILTTTPSVEGRQILEYKGIIFGEVISGVDVLRDFTAGLSNFFGGRSGAYEEELTKRPRDRPPGAGTACSGAGRQCGGWRRCGL